MAFYDKSARVTYAIVVSLIIHAVIIGGLVSTQFISDEGTKETSTPNSQPAPKEEAEPAPLPDEKKPSSEESPSAPTPISAERASKPAEQVDAIVPIASDKKVNKRETATPRREGEPRVQNPTTPPKEKPSAQTPAASSAATEIYVVKKGESLTAIARAHGCTLAELTKLNRAALKKHKSLFVGQKLRVPKSH